VDFVRDDSRGATIGLQWQDVKLVATGEEAFIPDTATRTEGAFGFQRHVIDSGSIEYGLRFDRQRIGGAPAGRYDETALNLSFGGVRNLSERLALFAQLTRSERHPSATELFADGPHVATQQFEIGDPDLDTERGITAEIGLRLRCMGLTGELRAFASRYHDYVFLSPTGAEADEMPVFRYLQGDSRFEGMEAELGIPLGTGAFTLSWTGEYLRARLEDGGDLPRMPPLALGTRLSFDQGPWSAGFAASHHFQQDRIANLERPNDAYTLVDADLVFRTTRLGGDATLFLRGRNLLDEDARLHTSPLKNRLPLPGRSLGLGVRIEFGR
jgi:iron complex outermembrane receptor protein